MIIDTHCHLDHKKYKNDLDEVLKRAEKEKVLGYIIPGADPKDLPIAMNLVKKYQNMYFAVGVHPYHTADWNDDIFQNLNSEKAIAVGECGLDYFRLPENIQEKNIEIEQQKNIFIKQIHFAKQFKKPLIVHIRDASLDSKDILISEKAKEVGGVLHCFNADDILLELIEHDFYFGIGGVVTFKNGKKLARILPKIPIDKILIETDAPYLTPEPHRGKRNEPSYTKFVVEKIASLLNLTPDEVAQITTENSKRLFKINV